MGKPRLGKRERKAKRDALAARIEANLKTAAEDKRIASDWAKANSALQLGYDRPVNRQAAKDINGKG